MLNADERGEKVKYPLLNTIGTFANHNQLEPELIHALPQQSVSDSSLILTQIPNRFVMVILVPIHYQNIPEGSVLWV